MSKISRPRTPRSGPTARERRGSPSEHVDRRAASRSTERITQSHRGDETPPHLTARGRDCGHAGGPSKARGAGDRTVGRDCGHAGGAERDAPFTSQPGPLGPALAISSIWREEMLHSPRSAGHDLGAASAAPFIRERRASPRCTPSSEKADHVGRGAAERTRGRSAEAPGRPCRKGRGACAPRPARVPTSCPRSARRRIRNPPMRRSSPPPCAPDTIARRARRP